MSTKVQRSGSTNISSEKHSDGFGRFKDKLVVHSAPSGTQFVRPSEMFLDKEEVSTYLKELKKKRFG